MISPLVRSKKAVSPVLATFILIVLIGATIVVTYTWLTTYMGVQTSQAGVSLVYDAVSWPNNTTVSLYIRNTGTSDATIDAVYIGTDLANLTKQSVTYDPITGLARAGGGVIRITVSYVWMSGTFYHFRISPRIGSALEFTESAP